MLIFRKNIFFNTYKMKKTLITLFITLLSIVSNAQNASFHIPSTVVDSLKSVNLNLYEFSKRWIGSPYVWGGTTKKGIDCSSFSKTLYMNVFNKNLPRTAIEQFKFTKKVEKSDLSTGDLVFFKHRKLWHVGIYLISGFFIHASNKRDGVKVSSLTSPYYEQVYLRGGRI